MLFYFQNYFDIQNFLIADVKQSEHFERDILNLSIMFLKETFKKEDDFILMFWVKRSEYFIEGILNLFIKEKKWKP